jgi:hypothetical protein
MNTAELMLEMRDALDGAAGLDAVLATQDATQDEVAAAQTAQEQACCARPAKKGQNGSKTIGERKAERQLYVGMLMITGLWIIYIALLVVHPELLEMNKVLLQIHSWYAFCAVLTTLVAYIDTAAHLRA